MTRTSSTSWLVVILVGAIAPLQSSGQQVGETGPDSRLFSDETPLRFSILADVDALIGDRKESPDRPAVYSINYLGVGRDVHGEIRTRGNFRLDPANCSFPPLRINPDRESARATVFEGIRRVKLVLPCRPGRESYEELVAIEYLIYRSYKILTGQSFSVRWIEVALIDTSERRETEQLAGFAIEEDDALAARLGIDVFDLDEGRALPATAFDPVSLLRTALFEYMIGGTDWSATDGHNVEILDLGSGAVAVPYDFDMSGLVDPPYATVNPDLGVSSVRERRYRGYCANPFLTGEILGAFRAAASEIMTLWSQTPLLSESRRERAIRFLEDFFDDIETDERAERRFLRDCREVG